MRNAISMATPSPGLLRFLRSQSEGIGFLDHFQGCLRRHRCAATQPASCTGIRQTSQLRRLPGTTARSNTPVSRCSAKLASARSTRTPLQSALTASLNRVARRQSSTDSKQTPWPEEYWDPDRAEKKSFMNREECDPCQDSLRDDPLMFRRRTPAAKAALEPRIRCTIIDEKGDIQQTDGEYKKSELIAKYGLLPRDLRKIDSSNLPHMIVRDSAILLNLLHLKVLIKHNQVLLFDVYGSQTTFPQGNFISDLQDRLKQIQPSAEDGGLPYEFRALEAVLISVTSELENDFSAVQDPVIHVLSDLEEDIDREKLRILLILSKKVSTFEQKARLVRDAIEELLEADDDLSEMYLTEKATGLERAEDDHTEIEMLLESYTKICDEVVQEASNLVNGIRNTEEIIRAILDANRNALMLLEIKFSVGTLGLAMGTFLAGLYGMNLKNFIEESQLGFGGVTSVSIALSLVVCWYGLLKLRKVQRISMMNNHSSRDAARGRDNSHWYGDDGPVAMLDARNRDHLRKITMMKEKQQAVGAKARKWFAPIQASTFMRR